MTQHPLPQTTGIGTEGWVTGRQLSDKGDGDLRQRQQVARMDEEGQRRYNDASTTTTTLHYRQTTTIQHPSTLSSTQQVAGMGMEGQRRTNDTSTTTTTLHHQQTTTTQHPHQLCEQLLAGWFKGANGEHNNETQHNTIRTTQGR
jgi:hypothetical protein